MYYARFHVENVAKETVSRTFSFTTRPVAAPEIAHYTVEREGVTTFTGGSTFRFETTGRTGAFAKAQIESNGAQSEYTFEYAPAEGGHAPAEGSPSWAPFTSGAGGTVTVAEDYADPEAKLTGLAPETAITLGSSSIANLAPWSNIIRWRAKKTGGNLLAKPPSGLPGG